MISLATICLFDDSVQKYQESFIFDRISIKVAAQSFQCKHPSFFPFMNFQNTQQAFNKQFNIPMITRNIHLDKDGIEKY